MINLGLGVSRPQRGGESGPPGETIVRTALGTAVGEPGNTEMSATFSVTPAAGDLVLVFVAFNNNASATGLTYVKYKGTQLYEYGTPLFGAGDTFEVHGAFLTNVAAGPGNLEVAWYGSPPDSFAIVALAISGINPSMELDQTGAWDTDVGAAAHTASPDSGIASPPFDPLRAHDAVVGVVATVAKKSTIGGTWKNALAAGQLAGTVGGTDDVSALSLEDAFKVVTSTEKKSAGKTANTASARYAFAWVSHFAGAAQ